MNGVQYNPIPQWFKMTFSQTFYLAHKNIYIKYDKKYILFPVQDNVAQSDDWTQVIKTLTSVFFAQSQNKKNHHAVLIANFWQKMI